MVADAKSNVDSERLAVIETRMETYVAQDKHEREIGDVKVMMAEIRGEIKSLRGDIKNLTWQIAVVVAILSSVISFLVSRIPV